MYMYDVQVNWKIVNKREGVLEYYEWEAEDDIETVAQMPVIFVRDDVFQYMYERTDDVPKKLLKLIRNETVLMKYDHEFIYKYACILSNKKDVFAFHWNDTYQEMKKSKLSFKQERFVLTYGDRAKIEPIFPPLFTYRKKRKPNAFLLGLTRREKTMRQMLLQMVGYITRKNDRYELIYWLKELHYDQFAHCADRLTMEQLKHYLRQTVAKDWRQEYEGLLFAMTSLYPHYEKKLSNSFRKDWHQVKKKMLQRENLS
ncbi:MAG TPA: DUF3603 family protein [Pseudogracilibacillus sp.]|nr:DUF3603 family protein [Pseudogracilibacillus sp.]